MRVMWSDGTKVNCLRSDGSSDVWAQLGLKTQAWAGL